MKKKKETILIVEDQIINQKIIEKILTPEYNVEKAENGQVALKLLRKKDVYAAIVLDLVMPVMSGIEFLQERKNSTHENIPVIVITGEHNEKIEKEVFDLGAWDFVTKPVQAQTLLSRVKNIIARNQTSLMERLRFISGHDTLTGLYNRTKMFEKTQQMLDENPNITFAFIRFDIDRFRLFNSAMGDKEGDRLLCTIAKGIEKSCKDMRPCTYGRIEGDVFCVCEPYDKGKIEEHVQLAQKEISEAHSDYTLETSFGVYLVEDRGITVETMLTRAAMASRKCKNLFQSHLAFYDQEMGDEVQREQFIINEMKQALEQEQFVVYLQPKYSLSTDKPCGAEALVRWVHPEKGIISPGDFIPVFEKNGFIMDLDYYMWECACKLLSKWKKEGNQIAPISVNMSRVSLYNPHVIEMLVGLMEKYDLDTALLNLEVTESAYMSNPELMRDTIKALREKGFLIMMDDFGSGYSSLNTLKEIDVDILKIDMKFLPQNEDDEKSEKILSSVVRMAGWIDMDVVAEGVETFEQKEFLESIGCGYVQGYFYSKPLTVVDYEKLIKSNKDVIMPTANKNYNTSENSIWSSNAKIEELLKSITIPVGIYEMTGKKIEAVRVNQTYRDEFNEEPGSTKREYKLNFDDEIKVKQTFEDTVRFKRGEKVQFSISKEQGETVCYEMKLHFVDQIAGSNLICATFTNITEMKNLEERLRNLIVHCDRNLNRRKMLIIDDQEISRHILKNLFEEDFEIIEANDGKEAMDVLEKQADDIAVILTDMIMPEMDGEEFLEHKNKFEKAKNIPVIVISSAGGEELQKKMLRLGVNDYITKPFLVEKTRKRIENVLEYNNRFRDLIDEYKATIDGGKNG